MGVAFSTHLGFCISTNSYHLTRKAAKTRSAVYNTFGGRRGLHGDCGESEKRTNEEAGPKLRVWGYRIPSADGWVVG